MSIWKVLIASRLLSLNIAELRLVSIASSEIGWPPSSSHLTSMLYLDIIIGEFDHLAQPCYDLVEK